MMSNVIGERTRSHRAAQTSVGARAVMSAKRAASSPHAGRTMFESDRCVRSVAWWGRLGRALSGKSLRLAVAGDGVVL